MECVKVIYIKYIFLLYLLLLLAVFYTSVLLVKVRLRQKYYAPQVQLLWSLNP